MEKIRQVNLISFSLYGAHSFYCHGAVENARIAKDIYPGWTTRFYLRDDVPKKTEAALIKEGAEVVHMPIAQLTGPLGAADGWAGVFWRFMPLDNSKYEHVIIRDVDSRLNVREKAAVDEWITSGKSFHMMRDHPWQVNAVFPIMAGMWGARGGRLSLRRALLHWPRWDTKTSDQDFLRDIVWPKMQTDMIMHGIGGASFPYHPPYNGFVGCYVDEKGRVSADHPLDRIHPK